MLLPTTPAVTGYRTPELPDATSDPAVFDDSYLNLSQRDLSAVSGYRNRKLRGSLLRSLLGLNLPPNQRPQGFTIRYARRSNPNWSAGITTLDDFIENPDVLKLEDVIKVVDPRPGEPKEWVVKYTPNGPLNCWRDGDFRDRTDADFYAVDSPEAGVPTWTELQVAPPTPSHTFAIGDFIRHAVVASDTQFFFSALVAGVLPAPSTILGDSNWKREARENIPTTVLRPAFENIVGDPADNAALAAFVAAAGPATTDFLPEGTTNRYYTDARAATARLVTNPRTGQTFASVEQAEASTQPGDTLWLVGQYGAVTLDASIKLDGPGIVDELVIGYGTASPISFEITGITVRGRVVVCPVGGATLTGWIHDLGTTSTTYLESFGLGTIGGTANVKVERVRLLNARPYAANGSNQGSGNVRYQERAGQTLFDFADCDLRSEYGPIFSGYTKALSTKATLRGTTSLLPASGYSVQETTVLNSGTPTADADFLIDARPTTAPGGLTSAGLSLSGQTLTLNTSAGNSSVTLPAGSLIDPDVPLAIRQAVAQGSYTGVFLDDPQPANSVVGMRFYDIVGNEYTFWRMDFPNAVVKNVWIKR